MNNLRVTLYIVIQVCIVVTCKENVQSVERQLETFVFEKCEEFVDPYAFHYDRYNKKMIDELSSGNEYRVRTELTGDKICELELQKCRNLMNNNIPDEIFSRRLINLLLSNAILKEDDDTISGNVYIHATSSQMEILRNFGDGKISMRQLDSILSEVIIVPKPNIFKEAITLTEMLVIFVCEHKVTCVILLGTFYIWELIRRSKWSAKKIFVITLAIMFIVSFVMTWWQLVKEAEIKLVATQVKYSKMPIQCQPDKMALWQTIISKYFNPNDCEKYYEAMMTDPLLQVTPMLALSHLFSKVLLHPASLIGQAVGDFIEKATGNLSFATNWIVTLLLFLGIVMLMVVLPFCLCGGSLGFGCGPLFHFFLSGRSSERKKKLNGKGRPERIETIYEAVDDVLRKEIKAKQPEKIQQKNNLAFVEHDQVIGDSDAKDTFEERHKESEERDKVDCKMRHDEEVGSGDS